MAAIPGCLCCGEVYRGFSESFSARDAAVLRREDPEASLEAGTKRYTFRQATGEASKRSLVP